MRINQIITDYIMKSILTVRGDMVVRGVSVPERFVGPTIYHWLRGGGIGEKPIWDQNLGGMTTQGDIIIKGATVAKRLAAVAIGQVLKSQGAGIEPAWGVDRSELTTEGDITVRGAAVAEGLAAVAIGQVLKSMGVGAKPAWGVPSIGDMPMAINGFTRNSSGDEVVSGLGFKPGLIFFLVRDGTGGNMNWGLGIANGTIEGRIDANTNGTTMTVSTVQAIQIKRDAGNKIVGTVSAIGGDGFTVTFTLTGACALSLTWFAIG